MDEQKTMSFLDHLEELRLRLIYSMIAIALCFIPSYIYSDLIFKWLMSPIIQNLPSGSYMIFTKPAEGFMTYLKVSIFAAFILSFPFILYQFWCFISPGLYKHEKKILIPFIIFGTLFFVIGGAFCYFIAAPNGLRFLLGEYSSEYVRALPSIKDALSFIMTLMVGFGLIFEFPLVVFILSRMGLVTSKGLREKRRYALVLSAIVAAVITPTTDALSMMFMLGPLFLFYEIGIVVALIFGKEAKHSPDQI